MDSIGVIKWGLGLAFIKTSDSSTEQALVSCRCLEDHKCIQVSQFFNEMPVPPQRLDFQEKPAILRR